MMFTTYLVLISAAFLSFASTTKATLHPFPPLAEDSEVCKVDIVTLVSGLNNVPFFDDITTLVVASMVRSSCSVASGTMAEASRPAPSAPVDIDDPLPIVVSVETNAPSFQRSTTLVPLTIDGPDLADIDASSEICPWTTALPLTISGILAERTVKSTFYGPVVEKALITAKAAADLLPMTTTPVSNVTYLDRGNVFLGETSLSMPNNSINPVSRFLGDGSSIDSVLGDLRIVDCPIACLSDASIAGVVPRGRAPDTIKDRFPIQYLLLWWFGIGIIGSLVGSNFPSAPFFGKCWMQTFGNVSLALDKALEKGQSLGGRLGGKRENDQALPAEYLYLIKVPAYSAFAINLAMAFFRHFHRRGGRPFVPRGLLTYYRQRPILLVNIPLRNALQLDVLPRQIVEAQILQQRAAINNEDEAATGNHCRALIVSPSSGLMRRGHHLSDSQQQEVWNQIHQRFGSTKKSELQRTTQCQALTTRACCTETAFQVLHSLIDERIRSHVAAILPPTCANTSGVIHHLSLIRQPLIHVIDPQRFGFMIACAVRVGPHRDVATEIIMEHLGIDHRINEITAARDEPREEPNNEFARSRNLELSLAEVGGTIFQSYETNTMEIEPATAMDTAKQPENAAETTKTSLEQEEKENADRSRRTHELIAKIDRHLERRHGAKVEEGRPKHADESLEQQIKAMENENVDRFRRCHELMAEMNRFRERHDNVEAGNVSELNEMPEEETQIFEENNKVTKGSQDQAIAKLEKDLKDANTKAAELSEANKSLENEKKQAEQDHTQAIDQLKEKLATTIAGKDHLAEANQLLRDRLGRLDAKKTAESAKLNSQLEEKESALNAMKAAKIESDKANQKTIDDLTKQLQECKSSLKKETELETGNEETKSEISSPKAESDTLEQNAKPHEKTTISWADECAAASSFWNGIVSPTKNTTSSKPALEIGQKAAMTLGDRITSIAESMDTGDFARSTIDIFEDSISSGSTPTVKLFIKAPGTSPVQTSGVNSTTATPSSSRSSSTFPSWNEYFAGRTSTTSVASDEWEDVSEASVKVAKRGKKKAQTDTSTVIKKGRGFVESSAHKRLLRF